PSGPRPPSRGGRRRLTAALALLAAALLAGAVLLRLRADRPAAGTPAGDPVPGPVAGADNGPGPGEPREKGVVTPPDVEDAGPTAEQLEDNAAEAIRKLGGKVTRYEE